MHSTFVRAFTFNDMVTTPRNYIDHLKNEHQAQSSLLCSLRATEFVSRIYMDVFMLRKKIFTSN